MWTLEVLHSIMLVIFVSLLFQLVCAAEAPPVNYFPVCSVQVFHGRNAISYASVTLDEVIVGEEKLVPQDPMLPARYSYNPGLSHPVLSNDSFIQIGPDVALRYMQACEQVVFQGFQAARKCQVVSLRAANLDTLQFLEVRTKIHRSKFYFNNLADCEEFQTAFRS